MKQPLLILHRSVMVSRLGEVRSPLPALIGKIYKKLNKLGLSYSRGHITLKLTCYGRMIFLT
ncbi:Signal transduction histidine kinase [Pseudomonas syringae pv. actinidiae]|uniref:Signal transduction histidine kinase n=1 Tax=Pseudomonas syringae pv. actinidiae TaxID=103796 RepID=A0A2V0QLL1_PSESF|nr:Signal transduction histidine kinase [Pseudomonas syringae pv. actinidiae]